MRGRVVRVLSDRFAVDVGGDTVFVKSRKKVKRETLPLPGDVVWLEDGGEYVLSRIEPRRNRLIRPPVANVDNLVITIAPLPAPDFLTVDKILLSAHKAGIAPVLCVNKTDILPPHFVEDVQAQYDTVAEVVTSCAATGDVSALRARLAGGFSCFAGQSAVGKTSLINAVCGVRRQVGALSEKTLRGKNTTTGVELLRTDEDTYIADTPGFGAYDLLDIQPADLPLYYDEYVALSGQCKYHMCSHTNEPDCAVRAAVEDGRRNAERYARYKAIFEELKRKDLHRKSWRNTYESK